MYSQTANFIVREDSHGIHELSIPALLSADGRIFLNGPIDSESVGAIIRKMIYLTDNNIPIRLYIDSTGGEVRAGLALIDTMDLLSKKTDIDLICIGKAYSMAAVILATGKKGHRFMLPHSELMIHEPLLTHGAGGSASSVKTTAETLIAMRDTLSLLLSQHTGKTVDELNAAMGFDNYMNAQEAIDFGFVDAIAIHL